MAGVLTSTTSVGSTEARLLVVTFSEPRIPNGVFPDVKQLSDGVTAQVLAGDRLPICGTGSVTVTIEQISLAPDARLNLWSTDGPILVAVETGQLEAAAFGAAWVRRSRDGMSVASREDVLNPEKGLLLQPDGMVALRNGEQGSADALVVTFRRVTRSSAVSPVEAFAPGTRNSAARRIQRQEFRRRAARRARHLNSWATWTPSACSVRQDGSGIFGNWRAAHEETRDDASQTDDATGHERCVHACGVGDGDAGAGSERSGCAGGHEGDEQGRAHATHHLLHRVENRGSVGVQVGLQRAKTRAEERREGEGEPGEQQHVHDGNHERGGVGAENGCHHPERNADDDGANR